MAITRVPGSSLVAKGHLAITRRVGLKTSISYAATKECGTKSSATASLVLLAAEVIAFEVDRYCYCLTLTSLLFMGRY
jgi:hypothetical protein